MHRPTFSDFHEYEPVDSDRQRDSALLDVCCSIQPCSRNQSVPRLLVNPGSPQQWEIQLKSGRNTLGRNPACDATIEHGSVSGTHCEIIVNGES